MKIFLLNNYFFNNEIIPDENFPDYGNFSIAILTVECAEDYYVGMNL